MLYLQRNAADAAENKTVNPRSSSRAKPAKPVCFFEQPLPRSDGDPHDFRDGVRRLLADVERLDPESRGTRVLIPHVSHLELRCFVGH